MDENDILTPIEATISRYLEGDLEPQEVDILEAWKQKSPENMAFFEEIKSVWKESGKMTPSRSFDTNVAWARVSEKMATPAQVIPFYKKTWFRAAAGILMLTVAGYLWTALNKAPKQLMTLTQEAQKQITLKDGTTVLLNAGSSISYPKKFKGSERTVALKGEAFFEVTKKPKKPFHILTPKGRVTVLGTSFSVRAFEDEPTEEVFVKTGKVRFSQGSDESNAVILTPGETGISKVSKKTVSKKVASGSHAIAWKEKKLVFKGTPLPEAILAAERFYHIDIDLRSKKHPKDSMSSVFKASERQDFLEGMELIFGLKLKEENGKFVFE